MSPYLFTIVMELFSIMMNQYANSGIIPTPYLRGDCSISHFMFADDLIVFSKASLNVAYNV